MRTHAKISITVFLIALIGLGIWGYMTLGDRFSGSSKGGKVKTEKNSGDQSDKQNDSASGSAEEIFTEEPVDDEEAEADKNAPEDTFVQVTDADCKNECKGFQEAEDVTYCKQVCGLTAPKKNVSRCEALEDLDQDYCYKDLAISKNDPKICDKIDDAGIKKTCKNRLLEDIIDQQMKLE